MLQTNDVENIETHIYVQ